MILKQIFEAWETTIRLPGDGKIVEIFKNPSIKELNEIKHMDTIRMFILSSEKKVLAFKANKTHDNVASPLKLDRYDSKNPVLFFSGSVNKRTGKIKPIYTQVEDVLTSLKRNLVKNKKVALDFIKAVDKENWSWVNKYIPNFNEWFETKNRPKIKKAISEINEEFKDNIRYFGKHSTEVFVNPTIKEIREIEIKSTYDRIRFSADSENKKLYIWQVDAPHILITKNLHITYNYANSLSILSGVAFYDPNNRKMVIEDSWQLSSIGKKGIKRMLKKDWSFLNKYFTNVKEFLINYYDNLNEN